jgi:hypothetical protein
MPWRDVYEPSILKALGTWNCPVLVNRNAQYFSSDCLECSGGNLVTGVLHQNPVPGV